MTMFNTPQFTEAEKHYDEPRRMDGRKDVDFVGTRRSDGGLAVVVISKLAK